MRIGPWMRWDVVERDGTTLALEDRWKGFTDEVLKRMEEARTTEDAMAIWKIVGLEQLQFRTL